MEIFYISNAINMLAYGSKGLLGVLTPQANTTVEPEFWAMLPRGFGLLNARMCSVKSTIEARLIDYFEHLSEHAAQFGNAPIQALSVACTGSSYLATREGELHAIELLSSQLRLPVTTSGLAMVEAFKSLRATRIALISPYPPGLTASSVEYWRAHGLKVEQVQSVFDDANGKTFHPIYSLQSDQASLPLEKLFQSDVQAIAMLGTGMPTLSALTRGNQLQSRIPVISCMLATAWWSCKLINPKTEELITWVRSPHWLDRLGGLE